MRGNRAFWCGYLSLAFAGLIYTQPVEADGQNGQRGWRIRIIAETDRFRDDDNFLGVLSQASDGLDEFDREEAPPYSRDYLSVVFTNPRLPDVDWGYSSDYRAVSKTTYREWPFTVRASAGVEYVTLTWSGRAGDFRGGWLVDEETDTFIRTMPGGSYSYPRGENDRSFTFIVDSPH